MKNPDQAIEKVLAGLGDAEAPAGMERRILDAVQDRASARSTSGWRRLRPIWLTAQASPALSRSVTYGVALAAIIAVALAIPAIHSIHRSGSASLPSKRDLATLAPLPAVPSAAVADSAQLPVPVLNVRSTRRAKVRSASLVRTTDSVALSEMRAPSCPEPPLPLTEQEKLLLRFVHARSREELAALDPVKWAARDAEERAEFEKFFGQSTNRR